MRMEFKKNMNKINYIEGKKELIPQVIQLREKLLLHHKNLKHHFAEDFEEKLKRNNIKNILKDIKFKKIKIIIAKDIDKNKNIGLCLGIIKEKNIGEIEIIYIDPEYQKNGTGTVLMEKILKWMDDNKVSGKELNVCFGNESVYKFYEKFNFFPRKTLLKQVK